MGDASATVTVNQDGTATPEWVTFYFQAQILQGTVNIHYNDAYGTPVASTQTQTLNPGTYTITPTPADLQAGYILSRRQPRAGGCDHFRFGRTHHLRHYVYL